MVPDGARPWPCVPNAECCTWHSALSPQNVQLADARSHLGGAPGPGGASVQLQCKHLFHPLCIRGWTMVGEPAQSCCLCFPAALRLNITQASANLAVGRFSNRNSVPATQVLSKGTCAADVGKKSVCPVCLEKVDLRHLWADRPWETRNISWYSAWPQHCCMLPRRGRAARMRSSCCWRTQLSAVRFDGTMSSCVASALQDTDAGCAAVHVLLVSAAARW
jgi:hypothetical protein